MTNHSDETIQFLDKAKRYDFLYDSNKTFEDSKESLQSNWTRQMPKVAFLYQKYQMCLNIKEISFSRNWLKTKLTHLEGLNTSFKKSIAYVM